LDGGPNLNQPKRQTVGSVDAGARQDDPQRVGLLSSAGEKKKLSIEGRGAAAFCNPAAACRILAA
jgi:hypothetical protein